MKQFQNQMQHQFVFTFQFLYFFILINYCNCYNKVYFPTINFDIKIRFRQVWSSCLIFILLIYLFPIVLFSFFFSFWKLYLHLLWPHIVWFNKFCGNEIIRCTGIKKCIIVLMTPWPAIGRKNAWLSENR